MNIKTIFTALISAAIFTACNNANEADTNSLNNALPPVTGGNELVLNPAHGMPGHRCDIAVGAPLNAVGNPAPSALPQLPTAPVAAPQANPVPNVNLTPTGEQTAPGFSGKPNPEHGLPGHRCDIEVGAILP